MRKLSLIIIAVFAFVYASVSMMSDSPHGKGFAYSCDLCHSSESWKLDKKIYAFDHSKTKMPLSGRHAQADCRQCHASLVFSEAKTACADCHTDMHNQTVGPDCGQCHTSSTWIVNNINELHQKSRFPLLGPHYTTDCSVCHKSASLLRFEPLGVKCFECHQDDYNATTSPNHIAGNYSTECELCHSFSSFTWTGAVVNHSFFPLTEGHAISDCNKCHPGGKFSGTPTACVACHEGNYNNTTNPNHLSANIPSTCADCHTTVPGWKPARFTTHDGQYFPIYSGKHAGTWNVCSECHTTPNNYKLFSCIDCHEHNKTDTDEEHSGVGGYVYSSIQCFQCHPTGSKEGSFDHAKSGFPLTGAHISTPCAECHINGYSGTPTDCYACHAAAFNQSLNPNHNAIGITKDCATCHTTNPDWTPATFPIHGNYWPITGAHVQVANNCVKCHNNNYNSTPNTCVGCHLQDYNQTTNPPHSAAQFPTDCLQCHNQNDWAPSTFNHDGQYFPIYSGKHKGQWNLCSECHTNPANYKVFSCIDCHEHNKTSTDNEHQGVSGYSYNSLSCFQCHPTGSGGKMRIRINNPKTE